MNDTDRNNLEKWLTEHMGEYIVKRAESHSFFDAYPDKAEDIPRKLFEYDKEPRWLYEALIALTAMLYFETDPKVAGLKAKEVELIPVIQRLEPKVQERISLITALKKEHKK